MAEKCISNGENISIDLLLAAIESKNLNRSITSTITSIVQHAKAYDDTSNITLDTTEITSGGTEPPPSPPITEPATIRNTTILVPSSLSSVDTSLHDDFDDTTIESSSGLTTSKIATTIASVVADIVTCSLDAGKPTTPTTTKECQETNERNVDDITDEYDDYDEKRLLLETRRTTTAIANEKVEIFLETPVLDENNEVLMLGTLARTKTAVDDTTPSIGGHAHSPTILIPKRLSDEFFSADDGDYDDEQFVGNHRETLNDNPSIIVAQLKHFNIHRSSNMVINTSFGDADDELSTNSLLTEMSKEDDELAKPILIGLQMDDEHNHDGRHHMELYSREIIDDAQSTDAIDPDERFVQLNTFSRTVGSKSIDALALEDSVTATPTFNSSENITTTPTSSRRAPKIVESCPIVRRARINLSQSLEKSIDMDDVPSSNEDETIKDESIASTSEAHVTSSNRLIRKTQFDVLFNHNSMDSSSSDNAGSIYSNSNNKLLCNHHDELSSSSGSASFVQDPVVVKTVIACNANAATLEVNSLTKASTSKAVATISSSSNNNNNSNNYNSISNSSNILSTSNCEHSNHSTNNNHSAGVMEYSDSTNGNFDIKATLVEVKKFGLIKPDDLIVGDEVVVVIPDGGAHDQLFDDDLPSSLSQVSETLPLDEAQSSGANNDSPTTSNSKTDPHTNNTTNCNKPPSVGELSYEQTHALMALENDHDYEDDTWADCEEISDVEELCTCRDYSDEDIHMSSEDELPSRDVDLSCYSQLDTSMSEHILNDNRSSDATQATKVRKRRTTETRSHYGSDCSASSDTTPQRKRIMLDTKSPKVTGSSCTAVTPSFTSPTSGEKRTPRSIIPTRNNPPPELCDWLVQFQRWSHAERLLAVDQLIEHCEPTQVRHMMKVIEPQFQRDFISLLPKELALQVLSYLEPKDLLRAAQTCRSWRFLCDDNLLWKEKCKQTNVLTEPGTDKPKRVRAGKMPPISSPWKAAYMRQIMIEMNWRSRPIRDPKILKGHDDHVITCLQFCGNRIVSGSDDNTLKVWSAINGKCLRTLIGHTGGVWSSQMSGNIIISGSTDRTLKVWNAETGNCTHTLLGHTSTVRCMHLHGNKVVSGSRDATLRVWDIVEGKCLHVLVGHLAAVRCVQYDGKLVVSGAYDYMVKVWNPERQECLHTLQGHTNRVYSLQFDGVHVVSGSLDTSIRVWDAETGSCKHTLMGHQSLTSGMELRQNILVSGNADSTVKVWDITNGQCLQTLSGPNKHQSAVTCLQFNSRFVITSSDDGTVKLWDVRTGEFIRNLVALDSGGSGGVVWRIRANDTKLICAVGSRNGTEETKLIVLDFDVEGACLKCS